MENNNSNRTTRFTAAGILLAMGIVFGDLGTSPLYAFKAIIGDKQISGQLVLGGMSAIFWTLVFQVTIKYVFITMRADNNGEGGIFSLFALVRKYGKWLLWPAITGGSFMIADSLITPPISVMSAMEGLTILDPNITILPITIGILVLLFIFQQFGTTSIGKLFGPVMLVWFAMIAILGISNLINDLSVLKAINPKYAIELVAVYPGGLWVLGGVFLCTTGAEALYADMGHVGRRNIQMAWIFIKISLLLCYFGEAALLLKYNGQYLTAVDAFYGMVPKWFLIPSIIIATGATIIASQALISGTFTLFSEAISLNVWPKLRIQFPTNMRGQVYVPAVNWMMMMGCIAMALHFKKSSNMEAAYGLSVTVTMLMTTFLLSYHLYIIKVPKYLVLLLFLLFSWIEVTFLVANLSKFAHGGWITLAVGAILVSTMYIWFTGKNLINQYKKFVELKKNLPLLKELSNDTSVPKYATHLVYLTGSSRSESIEERIIDSILYQQPKRADLYWFVNVEVVDEPYHASYITEIIEAEEVVYIKFKLGFRVMPRINTLFKKVVSEMVKNKEVRLDSKYYNHDLPYVTGDFRFIIMKSFLSVENDLSFGDNIVMKAYFLLGAMSLPDDKAYGLDYNNVSTERIPLIIGKTQNIDLVKDLSG